MPTQVNLKPDTFDAPTSPTDDWTGVMDEARASAAWASARLLESVVMRAQDGIVITEAQPTVLRGRRITFVNDAFLAMTGFAREELLGRTMQALRGPVVDEAALARVRDAHAERAPIRVELPNARRDGQVLWTETSILPGFDSNGDLTHWTWIFRDTTERRRAEETLKRQNAYLEALNETALGLLNHQDAQVLLNNIVRRACALMEAESACVALQSKDGQYLESFVERGLFELVPRERMSKGVGLMGKVWDSGQTIVLEDYAAWNGRIEDEFSPLFHGSVAVPLKFNGQIGGVLEVAHSASSRKVTPDEVQLLDRFAQLASIALDNARLYGDLQTERDFADRVMSMMGQGLVIGTRDGYVKFANPAFARRLGYDPDELVGLPVTVFYLPGDWEEFVSVRQHLLSSVKPITHERRLRRKDGHTIPTLCTSTQLEVDGHAEGIITVVTDLTEVKQAEEALKRAHTEALEASKLKSQFLATMSHEIRTPMNAIMGMTELLLDTPLNGEQRDMLETVYNSSEALLEIINDMLDYARIEADKLRLEHDPFDPRSVVRNAVHMLERRAAARNLRLTLEVAANVPRIAVGDAGRVRQVLVNLIGNAIKFTPTGRVDVRADAVRGVGPAGDFWTLRCEVEDTGIGISEPLRARLFEPFSQGDGSFTREYGGTGLGLAICKRLVQLMDGEIDFTSREGHGTTFWFSVRLGALAE